MPTPLENWYIRTQSTKSLWPRRGRITSSYRRNEGTQSAKKRLKRALCLEDGVSGRERKAGNPSSYSSLNTRVWCYDNLSQTAVSNVQTISAIHGFLYSLIDRERFLRPEPEVSVSSQLALSVQGHSTFDRPVAPWDPHWDNAARHTSGALLQRTRKK